MKRSAGPLFAALLLALTALVPLAARAAQPDPLQAAGPAGGLVLVPGEGRARLELPGGRTVLVPLPAGTELSSLAALAGGRWATAGSTPAAEGGRRLLILRGDAAGHGTLAAPPGQTGRSRHGPVLLVHRGALAGLAWLEGDGDQSLGVRAARLVRGRWSAPEVVAPPGAGSQLALAGAVLADGSWLLAWSAYDGNDDEILWSRRGGEGGWSAPARAAADNRVPDITPALAAAGDGALLSWSRYDGNDYRLVVARLVPAGGSAAWSAPETVGPAGSLYPAFQPAAAGTGPRLLYFTVRPRAWSLLEMDAAGKALRRAEAASESSDRPVVTATAADEMSFRWPGRRAATAALQRVERPERER